MTCPRSRISRNCIPEWINLQNTNQKKLSRFPFPEMHLERLGWWSKACIGPVNASVLSGEKDFQCVYKEDDGFLPVDKSAEGFVMWCSWLLHMYASRSTIEHERVSDSMNGCSRPHGLVWLETPPDERRRLVYAMTRTTRTTRTRFASFSNSSSVRANECSIS